MKIFWEGKLETCNPCKIVSPYLTGELPEINAGPQHTVGEGNLPSLRAPELLQVLGPSNSAEIRIMRTPERGPYFSKPQSP